jgi:hypothetical protein
VRISPKASEKSGVFVFVLSAIVRFGMLKFIGFGYVSNLKTYLKIEGVDDIVTVLVKRDVNGQRFYLHSVTTKNNLLKTSQSSADAEASKQSRTVDSGGNFTILQSLLKFNNNSVSKVVDANGEPLVVYHGSSPNEPFTVFRPSQGALHSRDAIFTTNSKKLAQDYAAASWLQQYHDSEILVYPLFVNAQNPHVVDATGRTDLMDMLDSGIDNSGKNDSVIFNNIQDASPASFNKNSRMNKEPKNGLYWAGKEVADKNEGADDVNPKVRNRQFNVAVFSPSQIKSATGNTGAYDGDNEDIRFSLSSPALNHAQDIMQDLWKDASGTNLLKGMAKTINPFDYSRSSQWFDRILPESVKNAIAFMSRTPVNQAAVDADKRPFVDAALEREETKIGFNLALKGWDGKTKATTFFGRVKDAVSQWENSDKSTAWGRIQDEFVKLSADQRDYRYTVYC